MIKDYIKEFDTDSEYQSYIAGDPVLPNVSYIVETNVVEFKPYVPSFFCKLTLNDGSTVELQGSGALTSTMVAQYKSSVVSAEIGELCTSIGNAAFYDYTGLTSVTIPSGVTSIGNNAFHGCTGLTSITIGSGVTIINGYAFNNCSGLTSVTIPDSVTSIGAMAFAGCSNLTNLTIGSGVTSIGEDAFGSCYFTSANFVNNSSLDEVSNNYWGAKIYDTNIDGLLIKNNEVIKYMGTSNSVTIPSSVTSIGNSAFKNCSGLTSITIPNSVTSIGEKAFRECSGLISITCNATTAPTIKSNTFQNVKTGGTLTVPTGSTGYNVWMGTGNYYLGKYNWTKVEQ